MGKKDRLPKEEYNALLQQVYERDKWQCRICRRRDSLSVHHVIFRSHGGKDILSNLITLCVKHHEEVHSYEIKISYNGYDFQILRLVKIGNEQVWIEMVR